RVAMTIGTSNGLRIMKSRLTLPGHHASGDATKQFMTMRLGRVSIEKAGGIFLPAARRPPTPPPVYRPQPVPRVLQTKLPVTHLLARDSGGTLVIASARGATQKGLQRKAIGF